MGVFFGCVDYWVWCGDDVGVWCVCVDFVDEGVLWFDFFGVVVLVC